MDSLVEPMNQFASNWAAGMWTILWQTGALAALVLILTKMVRMQASLRFWLWMLVPLRLLVMPLLAVSLPVLPASPMEAVTLSEPILIADEEIPANIPSLSMVGGSVGPDEVMSVGEVPTLPPPTAGIRQPTLWSALLAAWVVGVLVFAVRLGRAWYRTTRLIARATPETDGRIERLARQAADALDIPRVPRLVMTDHEVSPLVYGMWRPVIVLPAALVREMPDDQVLAVLTHELAHIERRDPLLGWIPAICQVFYFFNPVFYLAQFFVLLEREAACDAVVLGRQNTPPAVYADALLRAATGHASLQNRLSGLAVTAESFAQLKRRLNRFNELTGAVPMSRTSIAACIIFSVVALPGVALTRATDSGREGSLARNEPTRPIMVAVINSEKHPVVGAGIEAIARFRPVAHATTNAEGLATLNVPLNSQVQWIWGLKSGEGMDYYECYTPKSGDDMEDFPPGVDADELPANVNLVLNGARTISIEATDTSGISLSGVNFVPWCIAMADKHFAINLSGSDLATVRSDAAGIAAFDWITTKSWNDPADTFLVKNGPFHWPDPPVDLYASEEDRTIRATLWRNGSISGRVKMPNGDPAVGITVLAEGRGPTVHFRRAVAQTGADGSYRIDAFPGQSYALTIESADWIATRTGITVNEGQTVEGIDLQLEKGVLVQGRVVKDEAGRLSPVAGVLVLLGLEDRDLAEENRPNAGVQFFDQFEHIALQRRVFTDDEGRWIFRLTPGEYRVCGVGATTGSGPGSVHSPYELSVAATDSDIVVPDFVMLPKSPVYATSAAPVKTNQDAWIEYAFTVATPAADPRVGCVQCHRPARGPAKVHGP